MDAEFPGLAGSNDPQQIFSRGLYDYHRIDSGRGKDTVCGRSPACSRGMLVMSLPISQVLNTTAIFLESRSYADALRMFHFSSYSHVRGRWRLSAGPGTKISPNVSFRNGQRIAMGRECPLGEHYGVRSADSTGTIVLGDHVMLAPGVFPNASAYQARQRMPIGRPPKVERDVRGSSDVLLGASVVIRAGVTTGEVPARIIGTRPFIT